MKKLVEVQEVSGEGLVGLLGQRVTLFCLNYTYEGKLVGVNDDDVLLENAGIVFETGPLTATRRQDFQDFPNKLYVRTSAIESYTVLL
jgi:hypothetical protein